MLTTLVHYLCIFFVYSSRPARLQPFLGRQDLIKSLTRRSPFP